MTDEQKVKRRAWAASHFGDKNLTDEELDCATYMPSENFSDGWDKGVDFALSHQWVSVEERLPEYNTVCIVFGHQDFGDGMLTRYTMMAHYDGDDFYDAYNDRKYHPEMWMLIPTIPQSNSEKQSI